MVFPLPCPLHALTGLDCPVCGSTRALTALLGGHWREALGHDPLFVIGLGVLLGRLLCIARHRANGPVIPARLVPYWMGLALGFAIARNIAKIVVSRSTFP